MFSNHCDRLKCGNEKGVSDDGVSIFSIQFVVTNNVVFKPMSSQIIALLSLNASVPWFLCTKEVSFQMLGENKMNIEYFKGD